LASFFYFGYSAFSDENQLGRYANRAAKQAQLFPDEMGRTSRKESTATIRRIEDETLSFSVCAFSSFGWLFQFTEFNGCQ